MEKKYKDGDLVEEFFSNGNIIMYRIKNGTAYHAETPDNVVRVIESAREKYARLRFCFGDTETGRDWEETFDTTGLIGRSTGRIKIPLLLKKTTSIGGFGILDHCIVRIEWKGHDDKHYREVYRHPNYHKENNHE